MGEQQGERLNEEVVTQSDGQSTVRGCTEHRNGPKDRPWSLTLVLAHAPDVSRRGERLILSTERIRLGREQGVGAAFPGGPLNDPLMSRHHAELRVSMDGQVSIRDLGSVNGTFVQDTRIQDWTRIVPGTVLRMGQCLMVFERFRGACTVGDHGWIGISSASHEIRETVARVAASKLHVLLQGESGTGKEVVARLIHEQGGREGGEFVPVNCPGIPETLFESELFGFEQHAFSGAAHARKGLVHQAHLGTLFLDEVAELALSVQAKLLRFLESGEVWTVGGRQAQPVDVRVVVATHVPLPGRVQEGTFRQDLYARLVEYMIALPALRDRRADIPVLLEHFAQGILGRRPVFQGDDLHRLMLHSWPMNVRELRTVVKMLSVYASPQDNNVLSVPEHVWHDLEQNRSLSGLHPCGDNGERSAGTDPAASSHRISGAPGGERRDMPSRTQIIEALRQAKGSVRKTALLLGRHRYQVYRWCNRLGINPGAFRENDRENRDSPSRV